MSGWWIVLFWVLGFIPVVNFISGIAYFIILGCLDSTPGANRFGPNPKGVNSNC